MTVMRIAEHYSHMNGLEYLHIRRPDLWDEIRRIIRSATPLDPLIDTTPSELSKEFAFYNWHFQMTGAAFGSTPFVCQKDRVSVELAFGDTEPDILPWFYRQRALYSANVIDVGIEIVPMKSLQEQMSSAVPYYEGELYNLIREGRGVPGVPLILLGLEA